MSEIVGEADLNIAKDAFSCILSNSAPYNRDEGEDVRGWMCFDVASANTLVDAFNQNTARFGQDCGDGVVMGDGIIGIEDVMVVLFAHYKIPPYENLLLNSLTTNVPTGNHSERCDAHHTEDDYDNVRASVSSCSSLPSSGRRALSEDTLSPLEWGIHFEVVFHTSLGMWVQFRSDHPLVTATLYIKGMTNVTVSSDSGRYLRNGSLSSMEVELHDDNHSNFRWGREVKDIIEGSVDPIRYQKGLPFGYPSCYIWVPGHTLVILRNSRFSKRSGGNALILSSNIQVSGNNV
jgi:hypothetical protein